MCDVEDECVAHNADNHHDGDDDEFCPAPLKQRVVLLRSALLHIRRHLWCDPPLVAKRRAVDEELIEVLGHDEHRGQTDSTSTIQTPTGIFNISHNYVFPL